MLNKHEGLADKQKSMEEKMKTKRTKSDTLTDLEAQLKDKQVIKERVDKRKNLEEDIELHDKCLVWLKYYDVAKKMRNFKDLIKNDQEEIKKCEGTINRLNKKMEEIKVEENKYKQKNQGLSTQVRQVEQSMASKNNPVKRLQDLIVTRTDQIERTKTSATDIKKRIKNMKGELGQTENILQSLKENETLQQLHKIEFEVKKYEEDINEYESVIKDYQAKVDLHTRRIAAIQKKIDEKTSEDSVKLEILRQRNPDAYAGVVWLRKNISMFKNPSGVHEPIMMKLKVTDAKYAFQVENMIGAQELEAFVCENVDDCNLLMNELRGKQKLKRINAVHSTPLHMGISRAVVAKGAGKHIFLDQVIKAPKAIEDHILTSKRLNLCPVFEREPNIDHAKLGPTVFFIGKKKAIVTRSQYCKEMSQVKYEDYTDSYRVNYLAQSAAEDNASEVEDDEKEIVGINKKIAEINGDIGRAKGGLKKKRETHGTSIHHREQLFTRIQTIETTKQKIKDLQKDIKDLEKRKTDKDTIKNYTKERTEYAMKLSEAMGSMMADIKKSCENQEAIEKNNLMMQQIELNNQNDKKEFAKAKSELDVFRKSVKERSQELEARNKEAIELRKEAKGWMNEKGEVTNAELKQEFEERCGKSLPDMKAKVVSLTKELERIPNVSQKEINEIKKREKDRDEQKESIEKLETDIAQLKFQLKQDKEDLVSGINEMVENINENFMNKMDAIGYAGQVILKTGEHELDFKNYGLDIMVKFHDKDALIALTNHTQSGGEKSVTTALYIMSLQEMTQVPFRCVDEINQGMDEHNEKAVWNLLVETANQHSAQFFYLAPKYPADLDLEKNIKVHICFNGNVDTNSYLDVEDVIKQMESAKRRKVSTPAAGNAAAEEKD